jgi:hypothetical protein
MATSRVTTVADYLAALPPDRRKVLSAVRKTILDHLPRGYEEAIQYGMIGYHVPLARYPDTYNGQPLAIAALASQKMYMTLYLMSVYADAVARSWFEKAWRARGKKLDMGKSCIRFKSLDDVALDVIGEAIAKVPVEKFIECVEASRAAPTKKKPPARKKAAKKK